ncbi:hypothetical protein [Williamsia sp. 1135]|uniref:hypothetical protein n=1 Tax=Williamsia sp. 1135 TaxID=1889262 RepID=UPI000A106377|nr:hypothetical protein [Williamsia sp. 1135]ORM37775.1 hypothetical protein BFL43_02955 [Williamsia sp. 1135]
MTDRRPALTREQHLAVFADKYPFTELATLGFRRCVLAPRFKKRRPGCPWIRVATFSDVWERAITLDVDQHGDVHGHLTVDVGADQPIMIAETTSAALQLVAATPGTPTQRLLRIPDVSARAL